MVRKPKQTELTAPRNFDFERLLCSAISKRVLVRIKYDDDRADRTFQPEVVFNSTTDKVLVSGVQINNPEKPLDKLEPRSFEVGRLTSVSVTTTPFVRTPDFNRFDARYANGIICSV